MTEETKKHLIKMITITLGVFLGVFSALWLAMEITIKRLTSPEYNMRRIEKIIEQNEKSFKKLEKEFDTNPFEPKMRPMFVNLVKEKSEYRVIVDLKALDNDETGIKTTLENNMLTVSGQTDKKTGRSEKMVNFSHSYYLDEDLKPDMMTKERRGDRYIITVPFKD